ncbi:formylglycine-generating enzyme family protein [Virgibacillus halophilus]|uniref:formylglycine-generating enzyme family protein n=1 Tax=Tigheibacillus halophilus TaxID=361280 RepID=UPI003642F50D
MKNHHCCTASRQAFASTQSSKQRSTYAAETPNQLHAASSEETIYLPGGSFLMGTDDMEGFPSDGEGPVRNVRISPFYIDRTTVTNSEFMTFIESTGYQTDAEKFGWSFVFAPFIASEEIKQQAPSPSETPWWLAVTEAYWKQPEGKGSDIAERMDHPVVHISWNDATAYCDWAGKRLPTESEWEFAARGGLIQKRYPWGDELAPGGIHQCNIWQGEFPYKNTMDDGYAGTAPAGHFQPNGFGLYQMAGNVWEWCKDWFTVRADERGGTVNPTGPVTGQEKVIRGGSYLCHHSYCNRYRVAARSRNTADSSSGNMGFRCAADAR